MSSPKLTPSTTTSSATGRGRLHNELKKILYPAIPLPLLGIIADFSALFVDDTTLLTEEYQRQLAEWLNVDYSIGDQLRLIYRGTRDGLTPKNWNNLCSKPGEERPGQVLVVRAKDTDHIFGCYVCCGWGQIANEWKKALTQAKKTTKKKESDTAGINYEAYLIFQTLRAGITYPSAPSPYCFLFTFRPTIPDSLMKSTESSYWRWHHGDGRALQFICTKPGPICMAGGIDQTGPALINGYAFIMGAPTPDTPWNDEKSFAMCYCSPSHEWSGGPNGHMFSGDVSLGPGAQILTGLPNVWSNRCVGFVPLEVEVFEFYPAKG